MLERLERFPYALAEELEIDDEIVIQALLGALAAQAGELPDRCLSAAALDELAGHHRSVVRTILQVMSHLIHYGGDANLIAVRDQLTSTLRQVNEPGPDGILPGDRVELLSSVDQLPAGCEGIVRYSGQNGTADVEMPLDDYGIQTVRFDSLRRSQPPDD